MENRRSKSQKFLEGRWIICVQHEPHSLVILLDNGSKFRATAHTDETGRSFLDFSFSDTLDKE